MDSPKQAAQNLTLVFAGKRNYPPHTHTPALMDSEQSLRRSKRRKKFPAVSAQFSCVFFSNSPAKSLFHLGSRHVEILNMKPTIILIHNFLTHTEIEWGLTMITKAEEEKRLKKSYTESCGKRVFDDNRTSRHLGLRKYHDEHACHISSRCASIIGVEEAHVEALQLVTYKDNQFFGPHHDAGTLDEEKRLVLPEQPRRVATMFVYLSSHTGVGRTIFPYLGVAVEPRAGSALVFPNVLENGNIDVLTVHQVPVSLPLL